MIFPLPVSFSSHIASLCVQLKYQYYGMDRREGGREGSMVKESSTCDRFWTEEHKPDPCHSWKMEWFLLAAIQADYWKQCLKVVLAAPWTTAAFSP